jgi:hypothetical protein
MLGVAAFDFLDSVNYLFLRALSESQDNRLRVVVQEAKENPYAPIVVPSNAPESAGLLKGSVVIESMEDCKSFELIWERYVAYLVTDELVGSCGKDDGEIYSGRLFRLYTKSHFLEHLARDTGGHTEPIKHYKLICVNHLIDVASYVQPQIRLVDSSPLPTQRIQ